MVPATLSQVRQNPALYKRAILVKKIPLDLDQLLHVDAQRRTLVGEVSNLRQNRNRISQAVAADQKNKEEQIPADREIIAYFFPQKVFFLLLFPP